MPITLRIKTNTTFKQDWREQSSNLAQQDKYAATAGQELRVSSIDRDAQKYGGDHWLVTFEQPLQPNQGRAKSTWYVYAPHVQELSGVSSTSVILRVRTNTTFKQDWREQSSNLAQENKYAATAGQQLSVSSIDRDAQKYGGDHWKVTFVQPLQPNQGKAKSTWFVYVPNVELLGDTSTSTILRVRTNTTFKQDWREQSSNLAQENKYAATAGQQLRVSSIDRNAQRYGGDHWKVTFVQPLQPNQGQAKSTWFVYVPDVIYESSVSESNIMEMLPSNINYIVQYLQRQTNGNTFIKPVTNINELSPSSIFLLYLLCASAVRVKKFLT
ncbi:hypothetical protein [Brasilonema sp. UFV-L1]|uniref:hypothetical protein n=1 Tax=Brasilonema sp. UFV-L1 TaxID=2234130 RepID=UPI001B7CF6BD|nr:hypothetical protein [Brasilonema sp. UFV-L1]